MPESDIELRRLADELAIRNLIARLAHLADTAGADDLDDYVRLFTEDASWEMPGLERHGRDDIREGARQRRSEGRQGPGTHTRHVITTTAVYTDGSDTARAESYFLFYGDTTGRPSLQTMGQYSDAFLRQEDGWKLAARRITPG